MDVDSAGREEVGDPVGPLDGADALSEALFKAEACEVGRLVQAIEVKVIEAVLVVVEEDKGGTLNPFQNAKAKRETLDKSRFASA
jgi:hypothetical protein